jgi:hypothetical protein
MNPSAVSAFNYGWDILRKLRREAKKASAKKTAPRMTAPNKRSTKKASIQAIEKLTTTPHGK